MSFSVSGCLFYKCKGTNIHNEITGMSSLHKLINMKSGVCLLKYGSSYLSEICSVLCTILLFSPCLCQRSRLLTWSWMYYFCKMLFSSTFCSIDLCTLLVTNKNLGNVEMIVLCCWTVLAGNGFGLTEIYVFQMSLIKWPISVLWKPLLSLDLFIGLFFLFAFQHIDC